MLKPEDKLRSSRARGKPFEPRVLQRSFSPGIKLHRDGRLFAFIILHKNVAAAAWSEHAAVMSSD